MNFYQGKLPLTEVRIFMTSLKYVGFFRFLDFFKKVKVFKKYLLVCVCL